jgi:hypothetical protein
MLRADLETPDLQEDERAELRYRAWGLCGAAADEAHRRVSAHARAAIAAVARPQRARPSAQDTPAIYVPPQMDPRTKTELQKLHRQLQRSRNRDDKLLAHSIRDKLAYEEAGARYRREPVEAGDVTTTACDDVRDVLAGRILEGEDKK